MQFKKQVVSYAEEKSNRFAASHYGVEPKRVREWKKDLEKNQVTQARRKCLERRGRKYNGEELGDELVYWIYEKIKYCTLVGK